MSVKEIKDNLEKGNVIIGLKETLKNMRKNKVSKIFICNNCLESARIDLENYSKISGVKLDVLNKSSEDLGVLCKKPHSISVLGILKE